LLVLSRLHDLLLARWHVLTLLHGLLSRWYILSRLHDLRLAWRHVLTLLHGLLSRWYILSRLHDLLLARRHVLTLLHGLLSRRYILSRLHDLLLTWRHVLTLLDGLLSRWYILSRLHDLLLARRHVLTLLHGIQPWRHVLPRLHGLLSRRHIQALLYRLPLSHLPFAWLCEWVHASRWLTWLRRLSRSHHWQSRLTHLSLRNPCHDLLRNSCNRRLVAGLSNRSARIRIRSLRRHLQLPLHFRQLARLNHRGCSLERAGQQRARNIVIASALR